MLSKVTADRMILGLAVAAILAVGLAAFRLSFAGLRDLAVMAAIPAGDAWLFPVVIDITTAIAAALAFATSDEAVRHWFSRVLVVGTVVSVAGNVAHAVLRGQSLPLWGAALVVSVAPVAVFADVHGVVLLIRAHLHTATAPELLTPAESPAPLPVPAPDVRMPEPLAVVAPDPSPMVAVSVAVAPPPSRPIPVAAPILPVAAPVLRS